VPTIVWLQIIPRLKKKENLKRTSDDDKEFSYRITIIAGFVMSPVMAKTNKFTIIESTASTTLLTVAAVRCSPIQQETHLQNFSIFHLRQACEVDSS
jgi:hypothetical protein